MSYEFFVAGMLCFLIAGVVELKSRKKPRKIKHGKAAYVEIPHTREERKASNTKEVDEMVEEKGSKFDHLFKFSFKGKSDEKVKEQLLKEAEALPDIPKVGEDDDLSSYFRIEEERSERNVVSAQPARKGVKPEDWLFVDPKKLEEKEAERREEKKDNEWSPPIFFGDDN